MSEETFALFVQELESDPSKAKLPLEAYKVLDLQRIGNEAVRAAQEDNRRLGVPNAY